MSTIIVEGLGKAYKQYSNRWARLLEWLDPRGKKRHHSKWVMQDVSFAVQPGEAVGIIGINGAGKSTLLKMITGTTKPTTGTIQMHGRVAALLELGMGFHPDFTGRQNAYMAGQLLGFSVQEISELMPKIEAFAEIGDYIDHPVRVYSSGMQMRLAFSVATAVRPDILIVDEALSVGDSYFQHKSFDRIREFNKQGTTLLIVSHDKQAIQSICNRAILLNAGRKAMEGEPEAVMDYYNALLADKQNQKVEQVVTAEGRVQTVSGSGEVRLSEVKLVNAEDQVVEALLVGESVTLRVRAKSDSLIDDLVVGYAIKDRVGQTVFGTNTYHYKASINRLGTSGFFEVDFKFNANIGPGSYSISVAFHTQAAHVGKNYEWRDHALVFQVVNGQYPDFIGVNWLPPQIKVRYE